MLLVVWLCLYLVFFKSRLADNPLFRQNYGPNESHIGKHGPVLLVHYLKTISVWKIFLHVWHEVAKTNKTKTISFFQLLLVFRKSLWARRMQELEVPVSTAATFGVDQLSQAKPSYTMNNFPLNINFNSEFYPIGFLCLFLKAERNIYGHRKTPMTR